MTTPMHDYVVEMAFVNRDLEDGFYAIPASFCNFEPVCDSPILEIDAEGDEILPEHWVYLDNDEDTAYRMLALRMHCSNFDPDDAIDAGRDKVLKFEGCEWLVLDDSEADEAWDKRLDNYLDECVPGADGPYFDRERWKSDARIDGRGHSLASHDGCEHFESTNNGTYYLYRQR